MKPADRPEHGPAGPSPHAGQWPRAVGDRSTGEIIVLVLCGLGLLGVAPFMVYRFAVGDPVMAGIDGLLALGVTLIASLVWRTRRIQVFSAALCILYLSVMVLAVNLNGIVLLGWAYPTITATFFLVRPRIALAISALALLGLTPVLFGDVSALETGTGLVTLLLTTTFAYVFAVQTRQQRSSLQEQANRDPLTRAGNRRALEDTLRYLVDLRARNGGPSTLILFDLDHFKRINDEFGHEVGDQVLVELVERVSERLRRTDALYRIGGEEFVALASGADARHTLTLAEDLRRLIEDARFTRHQLRITVSFGVAEVRAGEEPPLWLRRADVALYEAKNGGRNAVRGYGEGELVSA